MHMHPRYNYNKGIFIVVLFAAFSNVNAVYFQQLLFSFYLKALQSDVNV